MRSFLFAIFFFFLTSPAYADIALLIHEAKGFSGETTGAGHSAVYLSDVCADPPPFVLRKCRNGEMRGAVIATYPDFGAQNDYPWFAMPLTQYLYGVDHESQIPLYANGKIRLFTRETVRKKFLSDVVPRGEDGSLPPGRWVEIIGTALNRDLYALTVKTTEEQDAKFIQKYSVLEKNNDFNVLSRNCADFTKDIVNLFFPGSTNRDFINDLGITTPKALARSFTKYSTKRPELMFRVTKYSQLDGPIMRSFGNRNFSETAFTSKKYLIAAALTKPELIPLFAATYFLTGYYSIDKTYEKYPTFEMAKLNLQRQLRLSRNNFVDDSENTERIDRDRKAETLRVFGLESEWKNFRGLIKTKIAQAIERKLFVDKKELDTFYRDMEMQSEPFYDESGDLMLRVDNYGHESLLGITRNNILNPESDTRLAYKLMLAKLNYELGAPKRNRENFEMLSTNWQMMLELERRADLLPPLENPTGQRFLTKPVEVSGSKKLIKLFEKISH